MSKKDLNKTEFSGNIFNLIRILSLDVVLGTAAGGFLVKTLLHVNPPFVWWWILPTTVWVIYTCDHIIDSIKVQDQAITHRHAFHYRHRKILINLVVILGLIIFFSGLYLFDLKIITFGLITGFAVLIYLILISYLNKQIIPKEIFVALVYTIGIWGVPVIMKDFKLSLPQWFSLGIFFGLALLNLLLFSWYESGIDKRSGFTSFATLVGEAKIKKLILFIFFLVFLLIFLMVLFCKNDLCYKAGGLFLVMNTILWAIFAYPAFFTKNERYRKYGDGIFFVQFLLLIM